MSEPQQRDEDPPRADETLSRDEIWLDSTELLRDRQEIKIRHQGEVYRLRLTRSGKLILHK